LLESLEAGGYSGSFPNDQLGYFYFSDCFLILYSEIILSFKIYIYDLIVYSMGRFLQWIKGRGQQATVYKQAFGHYYSCDIFVSWTSPSFIFNGVLSLIQISISELYSLVCEVYFVIYLNEYLILCIQSGDCLVQL
jgi:hypothetical protein